MLSPQVGGEQLKELALVYEEVLKMQQVEHAATSETFEQQRSAAEERAKEAESKLAVMMKERENWASDHRAEVWAMTTTYAHHMRIHGIMRKSCAQA